MSEKILQLETKVQEIESKERKSSKNNLLVKIDVVPKKETILNKSSNDLSNKNAKPKKDKSSVFKFGAEARKNCM